MSIDPSINNNIGNSSITSSSAYNNSVLFKSLSPTIQADLIEHFTEADLNRLFPSTGDFTPILPTPEPEFDFSISQFFLEISKVTREFRNQLALSEELDFSQTRMRKLLSASPAAALFSQLAVTHQNLIREARTSASTAINTLRTTFNKVKSTLEDQNERIDDINGGNSSGYKKEKTQATLLDSYYNDYIDKLTQLGATSSPPPEGAYTLPVGANQTETNLIKQRYQQYTQDYLSKVATFNLYWEDRSDDISNYNSQTADYNQNAADNSQTMYDFLNRYELQEYASDENIDDSFYQPLASATDSLSVPYEFVSNPSPSTISDLPAEVVVLSPPSWISNVSSANADNRKISHLQYTPLTEAQISKLQKAVERSIYDNRLGPLFNSMQQQAILVYQEIAKSIFNNPPDTREDPLANLKLFFKRIFPTSYTNPGELAGSTSIRGGNALTTISLIKDMRVGTLLGKGIFFVALNSFNLKLTADRNELLNDQLQFLALNLIEANALQALLPSLGPIADLIGNLPTNSPIFGLLFSLSLTNRILESINKEINLEAIKDLIGQFPELASIKEEELKKLEAIVNTTELLAALNLTALNLGQPELTPLLLSSSISPGSISSDVIQNAIQEAQVDLSNLRQSLRDSFQEEGFTDQESDFLSDVGAEALARNLPTAPTPTEIAKESIDADVLKRSIQASIILSRSQDLENAERTARDAVEEALNEGPFNSLQDFQKRLERHLRSNDIERSNAKEIAEQAVVVSPANQLSDIKTLLLLSQKFTDADIAQSELLKLLTKSLANLLVPQLGAVLAQLVTDELAKTLFGNPNPDSADKANVKSPISLVNTVKQQLRLLNIERNEEYSNALTDVFKEYIKPSIQLNAFFEKLMNPAYHLLYAVSEAGIMYGQTGQKKALDVLV